MSQPTRSDRRVVVTGMGAVTPIGIGVDLAWNAAVEGRSGIKPITRFDASSFPSRIAGEIRDFEPTKWLTPREVKRNDRFIQFAIAAADMAIKDSGLDLEKEDPTAIGVIVGTGLGGLEVLEENDHILRTEGLRRISPFFVTSMIQNLAPGQISIRYGLQGPNFSPCSACATGNNAIGEAMLLIERGMADVIVTGGAEATITPLGIAGFIATRALSERNDEPEKASRPFDKARDGFVASEGAGILVLETLEHARKRGARIYAELAGYGASGDAHHITSPPPGGAGAQRAMQLALKMGGLNTTDIGYINAHATSTPAGDLAECDAIRGAFGEHATKLAVSSTKSTTGHLLGAAGGLEAIFTVKSLMTGILPPTINVEELDPACGLDVVPNVAREVKLNAALSNGFGFGGANATLAFRRME